jgi:hypothetical protein
MGSLRAFFNGNGGVAVGVLMVLGAGLALYSSLRSATATGGGLANERIYIDAKTGLPYKITVTASTPSPAPAPSGDYTGYPAELCYWTADGHIKDTPTPVLLENLKTPGYSGPTFCPDCGRLVVGHNPRPQPGDAPPPTKDEWMQKHSSSAAQP